jgi:hypothetical protein
MDARTAARRQPTFAAERGAGTDVSVSVELTLSGPRSHLCCRTNGSAPAIVKDLVAETTWHE